MKYIKQTILIFFILPLYHFFNKKHEALTLQVASIIDRMIKEKVLEELYKPYLK